MEQTIAEEPRPAFHLSAHIGWMQNWDTSKLCSEDTPWFEQMTLPRELSIKHGRLYQKPVGELEKFRRKKIEYKQVLVNGTISLEGIKGRTIDSVQKYL